MVSIIIVHYNTFDLTHACVTSCYQFIRSEFEIILVNNGAQERSLDEIIHAFPKIKYIDPGQNLGFAKGNNLGIQQASGDYILLLNSDCELTSDAVTPTLTHLEKHPEIGVLTLKLTFKDGVTQNNFQSFPSIAGDLLELTRLFKINRKKYALKHAHHLLDPHTDQWCDWVWGAFFLFRRADLSSFPHQRLSERYFMYGEDMEWCWQFRQLGKPSYYFSGAAVIHHMGQSNFGDNKKKWPVIIGNEIRTVRKFRGPVYTFFFRLVRTFKYLCSFREMRENWYFAKLYAFRCYK